jgi:hypothetical protein
MTLATVTTTSHANSGFRNVLGRACALILWENFGEKYSLHRYLNHFISRPKKTPNALKLCLSTKRRKKGKTEKQHFAA